MYELIQVTDRSCYIQCPAKIGLVRLEGDRVCLIDSGSDKDAVPCTCPARGLSDGGRPLVLTSPDLTSDEMNSSFQIAESNVSVRC